MRSRTRASQRQWITSRAKISFPKRIARVAYIDRPLSVAEGRALNPPLATARMLNEAAIEMTDKVLLVGAATGYTAAVLAELAGQVVALEQDAALSANAARNLADVSNVTLVSGPLAAGWAADAPYDLIVIDGAVEQIPASLSAQLGADGRLVAGMIDAGVTRLVYGRRAGDGFGLFPIIDAEAAVLPGFEATKSFSF